MKVAIALGGLLLGAAAGALALAFAFIGVVEPTLTATSTTTCYDLGNGQRHCNTNCPPVTQ